MAGSTVSSGLVRAMVTMAAAGALAAASPAALAQQGRSGGNSRQQQPSQQQPAGQPAKSAAKASILDNVLTRDRERDWTLRVNIVVQSVKETDTNGMPVINEMQLQSAAVVFPVNTGSGSSELDTKAFKGELKFNDRVVDANPKFLEGYPAGTRLGRWELTNQVGRNLELELELPLTTWSTVFDEKTAERVPWPASWPASAASALQPDPIVNSGHEAVQDLVRKWTSGNDPKKVPPVQLAKFLAGKVLEHVQPSGNGLYFARTGALAGVDLRTVEETARLGVGSEHDMVVLLAAVYRAAGLPARTVIGFDVSAKKDKGGFLEKGKRGPQKLRAWVEFCLYDEGAQKEVWVPVDVVRMRASSNRAPGLGRPWKYFGTHDELENVIPFAFQYHPPTTVVAHGAFSFWGWLPTPEVPQVYQFLTFNAITTPKRSGDRSRGR